MIKGPLKTGDLAAAGNFSPGLREAVATSYFDTSAPLLELPPGAKNILELINGKSATLLWKGEKALSQMRLFTQVNFFYWQLISISKGFSGSAVMACMGNYPGSF